MRSIFKILLLSVSSLSINCYAGEQVTPQADELNLSAQAATSEQHSKITAAFPSLADVVEPLLPAVVNVYTLQQPKTQRRQLFDNLMIPEQFRDFFEQFEGPSYPYSERGGELKPSALGSGFIIDSEGYIITNEHVIKDAEKINIKLMDNTELAARVVGTDARTDLALLKIEYNKPLPYVKLGNSNRMRVGDWVIAVGNPFGLDCSVAAGIISSKSRDISITSNGLIDDYIQTDAAINQGNSGGPLCNMQGEVIGVNTAIFSPSGGSVGIGFAIPSSTVKNIVTQLKKYGKVTRGLLGVKIQSVTSEIASSLGLEETEGVFVVEVQPNTAGHKAGLLPGDVIVEFAGTKLKGMRKLPILVAETPVGSEVTLKVIRKGKKITLKAVIAEDTTSQIQAVQGNQVAGMIEENGIVLKNITPDLRKEFSINANISGIIISEVKPKARWHRLKPGDIIVSAQGQQITDVKQFKEIYEQVKKENKTNTIVVIVRKRNSNSSAVEILSVF